MSISHIKPPFVETSFEAPTAQASLYATYEQWRREAPVFRNQEGVVYLTRHADCSMLLTDRRFTRGAPDSGGVFAQNDSAQSHAFEKMISQWMLFMDPPRHTLVRQAFQPMFLPRVVRGLERAITASTLHLLEAMRGQEQAELVESFAYFLPIQVICELLGVPASDWQLFRKWSAELSRALDAARAEDLRAGIPTALEIHDYFSRFILDIRRQGDDAPLNALLARGEAAGLTMDEIIYGCAFLIWSGHETTRNLIATGVLALHTHPEQRARFLQDAALHETAIEELLRFESPVQKSSRWTSTDVETGGVVIPRGTLVTALLGAANRDPAVFSQPDVLDVGRSPNPHLAFGKGAHHCLGVALARTEARIALTSLFSHFPRLTPLHWQWRNNSSLRSLDHLQVSLC